MKNNLTHRHVGAALLLLVVALVLFTFSKAGHDEPRLIIMGDSLSTTHESWPNFLREMAPRWNVQVMAQNGRTIRDFSIPRDLWTNGESNETVIYFLGAADMLERSQVYFAKYRLKSHIEFLLNQNFNVLLIVPPVLGVDRVIWGQSIAEHREMIESFRGTHPNLRVYDIDYIWDADETYDGIHPTAELSWKIAETINWVLALNFY